MSELGTIIVTGGSRGLGAAICRKLAALGHPVAFSYASNAAAADAVVREITTAGGRAHAFKGDVAHEGEVLALFDAAERALGPLGGLVNNAGVVGGSTRFADLDTAVLERTFAVNVMGTIFCAREAVRRLSTARGGPGGGIVNLSSVASRLGAPGELVHYAASKGAIDSSHSASRARWPPRGSASTRWRRADRDRHEPGGAARAAGSLGADPARRAAGGIAEAVAWLLRPPRAMSPAPCSPSRAGASGRASFPAGHHL